MVQSLLTSLFCPNFIYNLWILDIMIMSFFSYLLLKIKIYNHQYLSIIIIIIFGFILNIIEYYKFKSEKTHIDIFTISMKFLAEIGFSFNMVLSKYNMELIKYQKFNPSGIIKIINAVNHNKSATTDFTLTLIPRTINK